MTALFLIIIASLSVSTISLVGGLLIFWKKIWTEKIASFLVSFAAGTMLAVAFFDLLPEAQEAGEGVNIFLPAFLGIITFFFLERFVLWFHHHDSPHGSKPTVVLILFGDAIHNFIDGIAIAAAFLASPALGVATTLSMAAHEIPQEIADFSILVHGGMKQFRALLVNFISALTALIGAVGGFYFLEKLETALPILLAFTAGMFIYIASSDLIPEMHKDFEKQRSWVQLLPFVIGVFLLWGLVVVLEG